ncbi:hypothetical protein [Sphingomonas sp.]|uniref:hypothetical protein n=1 Tax=Sphingomonas sp. TaxID=28214 RepID=UPI0025FE59E4|nr:hypothetical protein [Sphingomonas sp.]
MKAEADPSIATDTDTPDESWQRSTPVSQRAECFEARALTPAIVEELGLERMFWDKPLCPKTGFASAILPIRRAA